jgi:predicted phage-related endonuclease
MSLTARQLEIRRSGITATDLVALAGLAYGRTEHDVFASKVLGDQDIEETEAMELGQALEPIVIPRLARKIGLHALRGDPEKLTIRHPKYRHHIATPDALFSESAFHLPIAAGQVKVCGVHAASAWGSPSDGADAIPEAVLVQVAWEIHCSLLPVDYVGALIGTQIRAYQIDLTPDLAQLIEQLCEIADRFYRDHVIAKVPPAVDGSEGARRMLSSLYPRNRGTLLQATIELEEIARQYFEAKREGEVAAGRMERAAQEIIERVGEADGVTGDGWRALLKWREPATVSYEKKGYRHFDIRAVKSKWKKGRAA